MEPLHLPPSLTRGRREFACTSCVDAQTWLERGDAVVQTMRRVLDEDAFKRGYLLKDPVVARTQETQHGPSSHMDEECGCLSRPRTNGCPRHRTFRV
ncbi:MAG: hypothetical protein EXR67_00165 [Dehalococcoidia bacterium]|nr:hypothetical protein [Dehalococcoidia bacterium]